MSEYDNIEALRALEHKEHMIRTQGDIAETDRATYKWNGTRYAITHSKPKTELEVYYTKMPINDLLTELGIELK